MTDFQKLILQIEANQARYEKQQAAQDRAKAMEARRGPTFKHNARTQRPR